MKTNTHKNVGAAVLVAMRLALVLIGTVSYAPTTSAHGTMRCDAPTLSGGNPPGSAYSYCEGHGWATLGGRCGERYVYNTQIYRHEGFYLNISCGMAGTSGRIEGVHVNFQASQ
jgi:hypothetical protein